MNHQLCIETLFCIIICLINIKVWILKIKNVAIYLKDSNLWLYIFYTYIILSRNFSMLDHCIYYILLFCLELTIDWSTVSCIYHFIFYMYSFDLVFLFLTCRYMPCLSGPIKIYLLLKKFFQHTVYSLGYLQKSCYSFPDTYDGFFSLSDTSNSAGRLILGTFVII